MNFNTALGKFSNELSRCHDQFQKLEQSGSAKSNDFTILDKEGKEEKPTVEGLEACMMREATTMVKGAIKKLMNIVEDRVSLIAGDLIEPLNMYI